MPGKVGIVTYYNAINEGAFLQAYCLKHFLEVNYGVDVYFVPNCCEDIIRRQKEDLFKTNNPIVLWNNYRRYYALTKAQKKYFTEYTAQDYDFLVVGSDEMWNEGNAIFSSYNMDGGFPSIRKISYAVSIGNFDGDFSEDVRGKLQTYAGISVRDRNTYNAVSKVVSHTTVNINADPVFLIDIAAAAPSKHFKPYLMIYGLISGMNEINAIKHYAHKNGYTTVSVDIFNRWCDKNIVAKSPFEFVGYIDAAEAIVTNMFHGTMLSIVREKNFVSLLTRRRKPKIELWSEKLGFVPSCIDLEDMDSDLPAAIERCARFSLDYKNIKQLIVEERARAKLYFDTVLS